ncbi:UDP-glucose dehydrogenase family protein [Metabacillus schmidteae]|uniref:UDP-glucose dehydrogenase family protein n=1 Tax=Metabacillus schmidteae TaxID=2730405 RepID=UPI00158DDDBA|nr:UDP-glucose/GDP-mannose dehydrogenase family protein [Metabacillus schmidteae]
MRNISVVGTGYVGLVTGVCLSEIGHNVTCIDLDQEKVDLLKKGKSPIFEPGLEDLIVKNIKRGHLYFTSDHAQGFKDAEVIYIAVGTPENDDGSVNLKYIIDVSKSIACHIKQDVLIVTKSTVPVGTNDRILEIINENLQHDVRVEVASNPEFLKEGSAIKDTFSGDRIVVGTNSDYAAEIMEEIYKPFNIPIYKTDMKSAEMIKYASNAFLATKISFINEIALICELVGANVEDVSFGVGLDSRIGSKFLKAGIGFGGSCFPKDSSALIQMSNEVGYNFETLKAVVNVNNKQKTILLEKVKERFLDLTGKRFALLGLAFKPDTDDIRQAASISLSNLLLQEGAEVITYDPVATNNARKILDPRIKYAESVEAAIKDTDAVFIVTEWKEFITFPLQKFVKQMKTAIIFDGRNCYSLDEVKKYPIEYYSIGRPIVNERLF